METKNMMIVGVGGQGTLLASKLLGRLLLGKGWGAAASVPGNVFQGVVCLAAALALYEALDRARALSFLKKERS